MAEMTLIAESNREAGTRPSGRLRAEKKIPGVVYGPGGDPQSVTVARRDLRIALSGDHGAHALINLKVGSDSQLVMVKDMQRNAVRNEVIHVDFLRVSRDAAVNAEVEITLVGDAHEVRLAGGKVEQQLFKVAMSAKPDDIPAEIVVDISALAPGQILRLAELEVPAGVTFTTAEDEIVAVGHINKRVAGQDGGEGGPEDQGGEGAESAVQGDGSSNAETGTAEGE